MSSIIIYMKDGTVKKFPHEGRLGGSYTKQVYYKGNFVIVRDEWGYETAYPSHDIERVEEIPNRI